jgi:cyclopropane fatty-acyl-phospholipid synthase-like methyltransferase
MSFEGKYSAPGWYYSFPPSEELQEHISRFQQSKWEGKALDLGAGEGRDSIFLADSGFSVTAVDSSFSGMAKLAEYARQRALNIRTITSPVLDFDIAADTWNLINAVTIIDHLDFDSGQILCERIYKGLKQGGLLFAEVFTVDDPACSGAGLISETGSAIQYFFKPNELSSRFSNLKVIRYEEKFEIDRSHGPVHHHAVAIILAEKK